jgi:carbamoyl-phosphate synthase small subunit
MKYKTQNAVIVLGNSTYFYGLALDDITTVITGEICFLTAQTGYQEAITDPSYKGQILVFTSPHIGITGVNKVDYESKKPWLKAVVFSLLETEGSHYLKESSLARWLLLHNIPCIFGVDTRSLVTHIRNKTAPLAASIALKDRYKVKDLALLAYQSKPSDSISSLWSYKDQGALAPEYIKSEYNILLIDFGFKENIVRLLEIRKCHVKICPPDIDFCYIQNYKPDGIVLSNGPGNPEQTFNRYRPLLKDILNSDIPILGICMGYQLTALTFGAQTRQMQSPHHGINHPVYDLKKNKVIITSQNHEFEVIESSLNKEATSITYTSLFDGSIEGIAIKNQPIIAVQFHPESSPGPKDAEYIFDDYMNMVKTYAPKKRH